MDFEKNGPCKGDCANCPLACGNDKDKDEKEEDEE